MTGSRGVQIFWPQRDHAADDFAVLFDQLRRVEASESIEELKERWRLLSAVRDRP